MSAKSTAEASSPTPRARGERCCDPDPRPAFTPKAARGLARDLAALAHPVRLQILAVLAANPGRVCVCDVEAAVPVKQPTVSHHLRILREAGLVHVERQGVWAYYTVAREKLAALRTRVGDGLRALG